jgi:hypothetical protein
MNVRSMPLKPFSVAFLVLFSGALALTPGCSKSNNVDQSTDVQNGSDQCSGADDTGCGVGSVCVLGSCRHGCTNDAECPRGSICIGDRAPFGCTTSEEGACSDANDCPKGLTCGIDKVCRHACEASRDCPRNEQDCVAGTCVSHSEPDAEETWFSCSEGEEACVNDPARFGSSTSDTPKPDTSLFNDGSCYLPGRENDCDSDDCQRKVWLQGSDGQIGGNSPSAEGSLHVICNVIGPGWQVVADCGSWGYCMGALPSTGFGYDSADYICSTAKLPPVDCGPWTGSPICEDVFVNHKSTEGICQNGKIGDCNSPFWNEKEPAEPCP